MMTITLTEEEFRDLVEDRTVVKRITLETGGRIAFKITLDEKIGFVEIVHAIQDAIERRPNGKAT